MLHGCSLQGQKLLPKVKLRSGLRGRQQQPSDDAAKGSGCLRLRLKALLPSQAASIHSVGHQRGSAGSPGERNGHKPQSKLTVKLGGGKQKKDTPAEGVQQMGPSQRSQSLKVKFRVGAEGGSIPQVDGAADSDSGAAAFHDTPITESSATAAGSRAIIIGVHPSTNLAAVEGPNGAAAGDEQHPPIAGLDTHADEAAEAVSKDDTWEADAPRESSSLHAELQHAWPDARQAAQQPEAAAGRCAELRAPDMELSNLQQGAGITGLAAEGAQQVDRPYASAEECTELDGVPATAHALGLEPAPAASAAQHAGAPAAHPALEGAVVKPSGPKAGHSGLTDDELAALPLLVRALQEWLDAQTGHILGIGDPDAAQVAPTMPGTSLPCMLELKWTHRNKGKSPGCPMAGWTPT